MIILKVKQGPCDKIPRPVRIAVCDSVERLDDLLQQVQPKLFASVSRRVQLHCHGVPQQVTSWQRQWGIFAQNIVAVTKLDDNNPNLQLWTVWHRKPNNTCRTPAPALTTSKLIPWQDKAPLEGVASSEHHEILLQAHVVRGVHNQTSIPVPVWWQRLERNGNLDAEGLIHTKQIWNISQGQIATHKAQMDDTPWQVYFAHC